MAWILVTIIILLPCLSLVQLWRFKNETKANKLPPGPKPLPIILHLLGKCIHQDLLRLSQKYGPIMYLQLGLQPSVIVSSPRAAKLFLKTHDLVFAGRPVTQTSSQMAYGGKNIAFAEYGPYWRNTRKMCTFELLSTSKINLFRSVREGELGLLIDHLQEAAKDCVVVDLNSKISSLTANMTCVMMFGKKYASNEEGFEAFLQEAMQVAAAPNLGDFIPFLAASDLQGLCRRAKAISKVLDGFLEKIIKEHLKSKNGNKDFLDIMLDFMDSRESEYTIDRSSIKAIILDFARCSSRQFSYDHQMGAVRAHQTSTCNEENASRIRTSGEFGQDGGRIRLEPFGILGDGDQGGFEANPLVPRESVQDCIVNDYHIPKKARIVINTWAIGRDPNTWLHLDKFLPERFLDSQVDVKGRDFQLIPFGSGRRGCPGMQLALIVIQLVRL